MNPLVKKRFCAFSETSAHDDGQRLDIRSNIYRETIGDIHSQ
jgi:hypothetical protein